MARNSTTPPRTRKPQSSPDLAFLQSLSERELTELVVIPLLESLDYMDIRYTHGILEYGKDIVCIADDPLQGLHHIGFTIKATELKGSVYSNESMTRVLLQAQQALAEPFVSPLTGEKVYLRSIHILTSFAISQVSVKSIQNALQERSRLVNFIDGPRLLDLVRKNLPGLLETLPDPTNTYLLSLQQRFLRLSTAVALGARREFLLPDIYTGGGLTTTTLEEAQFISFAEDSEFGDGLAPLEAYLEHKNLVLIADVGAGKTTLLKKLTLDLISNKHADEQIASIIPIFLELSALPSAAARSPEDLLAWLRESISDLIKKNDWDDEGATRRPLLLLDGFDEVPREHESLARSIQGIRHHFRGGVVITSRPSRVPFLAPHFKYYRLDPLSDAQIREFLSRWFADQEFVDTLLEKVLGDPTLKGFCRTPLLLTLYAILAASDSLDSLPSRRADIYEALTSLLLGRWDQMRQVVNYFDLPLKTFAMETLALDLHESKKKTFAKAQMLELCRPLLKPGAPPSRDPSLLRSQASDLFDEIFFRSSLIKRSGDGEFAFTHLSFQEFLAAKQMMRRGERRHVERRMYTDWWKNVVIFYFGLTRSMDGVRVSAKAASARCYFLVEYLAESEYTSEEKKSAVYHIVAKHLLEEGIPNSAVAEACRRVKGDLLRAVDEVVSSSERKDWPQLFEILLELGQEGVKVAVKNAGRLEHYPPTVQAEVLFGSIGFLSVEGGRKLFEASASALRKRGYEYLRRTPRLQRKERFAPLQGLLRKALKQAQSVSRMKGTELAEITRTIKDVESFLSSQIWATGEE